MVLVKSGPYQAQVVRRNN